MDDQEELDREKQIEAQVEAQKRIGKSNRQKPKDIIESPLEFFDKVMEIEARSMEKDKFLDQSVLVKEFQHFTRDLKLTNFDDKDIMQVNLYNDTIANLIADNCVQTAKMCMNDVQSLAITKSSKNGFTANNLLQDIRKTQTTISKEEKDIRKW